MFSQEFYQKHDSINFLFEIYVHNASDYEKCWIQPIETDHPGLDTNYIYPGFVYKSHVFLVRIEDSTCGNTANFLRKTESNIIVRYSEIFPFNEKANYFVYYIEYNGNVRRYFIKRILVLSSYYKNLFLLRLRLMPFRKYIKS